VAEVRERLLAGIVHLGCIGVGDLAALHGGDQLLKQNRHDLQADRDEGEAEHAAYAAAFQLQIDEQERGAGELADARVEHAPHRHDGAANAYARDFNAC
jgi:hypothetical protein